MIDPLPIPSECFEDYTDLDTAFTDMAKKLNEVISIMNKIIVEEGTSFEDELYVLVETWKKEAAELENPEMFPGFSREVCSAIARDKIHCGSELLKLIQED